MSECVVGQWYSKLDDEDAREFDLAQDTWSRVDLHYVICEAWRSEGNEGRPFSLTATKDHLLEKCLCARKV